MFMKGKSRKVPLGSLIAEGRAKMGHHGKGASRLYEGAQNLRGRVFVKVRFVIRWIFTRKNKEYYPVSL